MFYVSLDYNFSTMNGLWCKTKMMQYFMTVIMNLLWIHDISLAWNIELYLSHIHAARNLVYMHLVHTAKLSCHKSLTEHVECSPLKLFQWAGISLFTIWDLNSGGVMIEIFWVLGCFEPLLLLVSMCHLTMTSYVFRSELWEVFW